MYRNCLIKTHQFLLNRCKLVVHIMSIMVELMQPLPAYELDFVTVDRLDALIRTPCLKNMRRTLMFVVVTFADRT